MNLRSIVVDEEAVSPVIGVILMVAITVILAAVIGTFVLGAAQPNDPAPSADIRFSWDGNTDTLEVIHNGGESYNSDNTNGLYIDTPNNRPDWLSTAGALGGNSEVDASDRFVIDDGTSPPSSGVDLTESLSSGQEVRVIWESKSGSRTTIIGRYTIP